MAAGKYKATLRRSKTNECAYLCEECYQQIKSAKISLLEAKIEPEESEIECLFCTIKLAKKMAEGKGDTGPKED